MVAKRAETAFSPRRRFSMKITLATKITLMRVVLVPVVVGLLYVEGVVACRIAALAFILASVTDWLDGYIARSCHMVSNMGKFLDPLADKVLICSVFIMLVMLGWAPAWVVIVIVSRELIVTGLRTIAIDEGIVLAADRYGKLKTVLQMFAAVPLMVHYPLWGLNMHCVGTMLLYLSMVMAVFSCWNYCQVFFVAVKDEQCREDQAGAGA